MAPTPNGSGASTSSLSSRTFTLKPLQPANSSSYASLSGRAGSRTSRRLHVSSEVLRACRISAGDGLLLAAALSPNELKKRLSIRNSEKEQRNGANEDGLFDGEAGQDYSPVSVCFAWPSFSLEKNNVAATPVLLQESALEYGDVVSLSPIPAEHTHAAGKVVIKLAPAAKAEAGNQGKNDRKGKRRAVEDDHELVQSIAREALLDLKLVMLHQSFELTLQEGIVRRAKVAKVFVDGKIAPPGVFHITGETELDVQLPKLQPKRDELIPTVATGSPGLPRGYEAVGGLDRHITQIRELVELPLTRPDLFAHFNMTPPRGILLHGPPGTGKTLLASSIAASLRLPLFQVDGPSLSSPYHGETEQRLREIFEEAQEVAPSIIVIDEVDALVPAREDAGEVERRVVATLLTLMDGLGAKDIAGGDPEGEDDGRQQQRGRIIVIAATNRPNAIDQALRRPGRFDREIEIGVPDAEARLSILKVLLRRTPHDVGEQILKEIAGRTHGYVGADLASLVHSAGLNAIRRITHQTPELGSADRIPDSDSLSGQRLSSDDLRKALLNTRPSALRSVFLETPTVSWSDIGGQGHIKQKLQEVIEWPLKHGETFKRLGVKAPRGILLYGPPGCSKTLIARALASGAGVNFIAVKGPEVFNKYVGESERAIRETFRKARAAAPCIVFLDEVDVIASSREDGDGGGGSSDRILTTLLTEMDGIEELNGVTVLAATNRPDVIDSALMRPGRLDRILYVSPPDYEARLEILRVNFAKMAINQDVDVARLADMTAGCSGAELVSICQDAAFNAMNENLEAPDIRMEHLDVAAGSVRRRITPETVAFYEAWRDSSGVREV